MSLLFYSYDRNLDKVPYKDFIKAYGVSELSQDEDQSGKSSDGEEVLELTEEERMNIFHSALQRIREVLIKNNLSPRRVFPEEMSPYDLLGILQQLGIDELHEIEFTVLFRSLASDDMVSRADLEEALNSTTIVRNNEMQNFEESGELEQYSQSEQSNISQDIGVSPIMNQLSPIPNQQEEMKEEIQYQNDQTIRSHASTANTHETHTTQASPSTEIDVGSTERQQTEAFESSRQVPDVKVLSIQQGTVASHNEERKQEIEEEYEGDFDEEDIQADSLSESLPEEI